MDVPRSLMMEDRKQNLAVALGIRGALFRGGDLLEFVRQLLGPGRPDSGRAG